MSTWPANVVPALPADAARTTSLPRIDVALLLLCLAGVVAIRLQLLISTDFPINDGALFFAFIQALARDFPGLPAIIDYNGLSIPFAYPPLSFWLSAAAVQLGADPLAIVHRVPMLMNIGYVLMFALLLLRTGHTQLFVALAVLVFGTSFRSYEWLVMGGGLSRGLGSLFLLLTLLALMPTRERTLPRLPLPRLIAGGVCVGGAVLSHLEWGILAAFSALVALGFWRRSIRAYVPAALVVGLTALTLVMPWFWSVYQTHGLQPFAAASSTGFWSLRVIPEGVRTIVRASSFLIPFVFLGAVAAVRSRDLFWVIFLVGALVLTPRHGETPMVLSLGVLAANGILAAFLLLKRRAGTARPVLVGFIVLASVLVVLRTADSLRRSEHFVALPIELRSAMAWVASSHPGATFAVLNQAPWYYDGAAEWFPILAGAISTTTVQGREWLPDKDFKRVEDADDRLDGSTSCDLLLHSLATLPSAQFIWSEGVDFAARAAMLARSRRSKTLDDRLQAIARRLSGAPAINSGGSAALQGPGTQAGCFEAAGYEEVYSNARVRIFRIPP